MKEDNTIDRIHIVRHIRHCVVLANAILSLALFHYVGYLIYLLYHLIY